MSGSRAWTRATASAVDLFFSRGNPALRIAESYRGSNEPSSLEAQASAGSALRGVGPLIMILFRDFANLYLSLFLDCNVPTGASTETSAHVRDSHRSLR